MTRVVSRERPGLIARSVPVAVVVVTALAACSAPLPAPAPPQTPSPASTPVGHVERSYDRVAADGEPRSIGVEVTLPVEAGARPTVLFSHGLGGSPSAYQALIDVWVDAGYAVVAPVYPQTNAAVDVDPADVLNQMADASAVLDGVLADAELAPRIDATRFAAAGHSAGGITTIGLFTSARDDRLNAGIVLSGSSLGVGDDYTGDPVPILFVHGADDTVVSYASGRAAFEADPWPAAFITLPGVGHVIGVSADDADFSTVRDSTLAFLAMALGDGKAADLRASLHGDATLDDRLGG